MVFVPRLAFDEVLCNCTQFPSAGDIVRTPDTGAIAARLQNLDLSSVPNVYGDSDDENDKESGEEDARDKSNSKVEEELFTELMQLKGSSYLNCALQRENYPMPTIEEVDSCRCRLW